MSLTRIQAINEMLALVKFAWETTATQAGERMKWENVGSSAVPPAGQDSWARVTLRHVESHQATLSGAAGTRIFRRTGVLMVQVFEASGKGLPSSTDLAKIMLDALEGVTTVGGVVFRDVTINEVGQDGDFFQTNVVAPFEYDEVK